MLKLISPMASTLLFSRGCRLVAVLGFAASVVLALTGTGSAEPPSPCFEGFGF